MDILSNQQNVEMIFLFFIQKKVRYYLLEMESLVFIVMLEASKSLQLHLYIVIMEINKMI